MAYATTNPPACMVQGIGGGRKIWVYSSTDAPATVDDSGYFTNGYSLGMRAGDLVLCIDSDASPITAQWMIVLASSKSGTTETVDLSDGTAVATTNTN